MLRRGQLLLHELGDLALLLGQRVLLLVDGLLVLGHRGLLCVDLRLGLTLFGGQLGLLRVQLVLCRVQLVDGERDVTFGDLVVLGRGAQGLLVAAEDRVLGRRRAVGDVVGHRRLGQRALVLRHLLLGGRDVRLGGLDARVDL